MAWLITAPKKVHSYDRTTVFLAGGISNCAEWQFEVIDLLRPVTQPLTLLNPRRSPFPMDDPSAMEQQIAWEFEALDHCAVVSMWFSAGESVQPICMYEWGRQVAKRASYPWTLTLGIEPGYKREQDVRIQTRLACPEVAIRIATTLEQHAQNIVAAVEAQSLHARGGRE